MSAAAKQDVGAIDPVRNRPFILPVDSEHSE